MQRICPWAKLIVMLRNPTDRAYSQYQMIMDLKGSNVVDYCFHPSRNLYIFCYMNGTLNPQYDS